MTRRLSVADPSSNATGHLVNGSFALPRPLLVAGSPLPAVLRTLGTEPISNDAVTVAFRQSIGATDAAADRDVQQDADVHALDDTAIGRDGAAGTPAALRPAYHQVRGSALLGMAVSAPERPVEQPDPVEQTDPVPSLEWWFTYHGVPQFSNRYSVTDRLGLLLFLMLAVVAFQLGAAPYLKPSALELLFAVVVVMCLCLCVKPALRSLLEPECPPAPRWSIVMRVVVLAGAAFVVWRSPLPPPHSDEWVNFTVLLLTAGCTAALASRAWWVAAFAAHPRWATGLLAALFLAVLAFALEGVAFPRADELAGGRMQQAVPAVAVTGALFVFIFVLTRRLDRSHNGHQPPRRLAFAFPAAPLLALVLGLETALLPHTSVAAWQQFAAVLVILALLLIAAVRPPGRGGMTSGRALLLPWFAALLVIAYPAVVGVYLEFDVFGDRTVEGLDAFLLTAGINIVCLALAVGVVRLGLDRVVGWAGREALDDFKAVIAGVARGLPLLMILTVFLLMQAEVWQVAFLTGWPAYLVLVATMAAVGVGAMLVSSSQQLGRVPRMAYWARVRAVAYSEAGPTESDAVFDRELERLREERVAVPCLELTGIRRLNAVLVIALYQAIIFVPLALLAGLVFWGLTRLAVPTEVAAEWIYGDQPTPEQIAAAAEPGWLAEPWPRVALVLAAFCFMYLTVQIPSSKEQREDFLAGAERGIKQRLARLLVYRAVAGPPDPQRAVGRRRT